MRSSLGCSNEEEAIRQQILDQVKKSGGNVREAFGSEFYLPLMRRAMETYDENKARRLFATFKRNGTWHCPTLTVLRNLAYIDDPSVQDNPDLKYIPQGMRSFLAPKKDPRNRSAQALRDAKQQMVRVYELVRLMKECEVPLLAGTDVLNPFCLPGFSLHGELQLMVDAGLSNAAALQTATINPGPVPGKRKNDGVDRCRQSRRYRIAGIQSAGRDPGHPKHPNGHSSRPGTFKTETGRIETGPPSGIGASSLERC